MLVIIFFCTFLNAKQPGKGTIDSIRRGFNNIPDSIRIGCYWYWLSDNISKEGIIKDLHAMKKAGITRAYIGNIGLENIPYGDVKIFSSEWWDIVHTALKTATELDIEIGIFNSPGWSQSGGPWVKPEQSMRYLAATDTLVKGNNTFIYKMPGYTGNRQIVKVIAYPVPTEEYSVRQNFQLKRNEPVSVVISTDSSKTIRSLKFRTTDYIWTKAWIQALEGEKYKTIRTFEIDRSNYQKNVGFDPYAPIIISLPETKSTEFRLFLDIPANQHGSSKETSVTLSSERVVERYPEQSLAKMFQRPLPFWDTYMWPKLDWHQSVPEGAISPNKVVDLAPFTSSDGILRWKVPKGDWIVSILEMKPTGTVNSPATPEATGPEIDKMNKQHVAAHFHAFMGEILGRIPADDRKSLKIAVQDSYETGGQNWTDDMHERFKKVYGYDPTPYLPVLSGKVIGNEDISNRFLWDLRRLIADRIAYDYVGGLTEICHQHGLTTWLENYGHWGFPGEFLQYGGQSDEVGGEFWSIGELGDIENRNASSCAHIYGKNRVWSESCTSGGPNYGRYPADMKARIDRFFTEGINATLLHVYIHQPYEDKNPGMSAWFGNDFNRKNTWFSQIDVFTDYLRRSNLLLQQGKYVADVAYFIGEDAPKMRGIEEPELPKGYSFDYINAEVLMTRASVKDGYLTLPDGMRYRLLILPDQKTMRPELLKKINELVSDGLAVYGEAPEYSPSLQNYPDADKEVRRMGEELVANHDSSKGKVFKRGINLQKALFEIGIRPDFKTVQDSILFIHRSLSDGEIYFLSNSTNKKVSFEAEFRVPDGLWPELWNPLTKEIRQLTQYIRLPNSTSIDLELYGYESCFIVFSKGEKTEEEKSNFPAKEVIYTVDSPWQVAFETGKRGLKAPVRFDKLTNWIDSDNDSIKYFSGEAVYTTTFTLDRLPSKELYIDLGHVMVMAKVKLNGQYIGGVWAEPYRLNVTDYLKPGENKLEITVVNNWQNRLIGDLLLPEEQRQTWTTVNHFTAETPLQSSGLLGPVEIQSYDYDIVIR